MTDEPVPPSDYREKVAQAIYERCRQGPVSVQGLPWWELRDAARDEMRALADAALSVPPPAEPIDDDGEAICPSCGKPCWSFREMRHCEHCMTPLAPPAEPVPEDERDDRARRYIAVVQAPEGYPPPDRPHATEASIQPTIHSVVLEDDYLAALRASRPSPAPQTAAGAEGDYSFAPERDPASSRSADAPPAAPALTPEAARGLLDTLDAAECEPEFNPSWLSGAKSALRTLADVSEGGPSDD